MLGGFAKFRIYIIIYITKYKSKEVCNNTLWRLWNSFHCIQSLTFASQSPLCFATNWNYFLKRCLITYNKITKPSKTFLIGSICSEKRNTWVKLWAERHQQNNQWLTRWDSMRLIRKLVRGKNCKDESKGVEKSKKGSDQNGAE